MKRNLAKVLPSILLLAAIASGSSMAQTYPSRLIRLIVPAAAGSPPDIRARWFAEQLRPALGQALIVENKPGAGGIIGTRAATSGPSDGYTLLWVHQGTLVLNPHLFPHLPYDPLKDLAPISRLGITPLVLSVHPDVPAHSVKDLIRLAQAKPDQLTFGSPGMGTPPHMAGELFRHLAHIAVTHVPYKSAPAVQIDLLAGRLSYSFDGLAFQMSQIQAGKIRALAVSGTKRFSSLPGVPTISESGLPGYEYWSWMGICAPAGTPKEIISQLNHEIAIILRTQAAQDFLAQQGGEETMLTTEEFSAYIKSEYERWGKTIHELGIRGE